MTRVPGQAAAGQPAAYVPLLSVPLRRNHMGPLEAMRRAQDDTAGHLCGDTREESIPTCGSSRLFLDAVPKHLLCRVVLRQESIKQGPSPPARTAISVRWLCGRGGMRYTISVRRCIAPGTSYSLGSRGSITRPEVVDPRRGKIP